VPDMKTEGSKGRVNEVLFKVILSLVRKASFAHHFEEMILRFIRLVTKEVECEADHSSQSAGFKKS